MSYKEKWYKIKNCDNLLGKMLLAVIQFKVERQVLCIINIFYSNRIIVSLALPLIPLNIVQYNLCHCGVTKISSFEFKDKRYGVDGEEQKDDDDGDAIAMLKEFFEKYSVPKEMKIYWLHFH